ncbi:MAG: ATP-binding protein [Opitutales bacterium]|nr:ATP-binding protein [Opitutales bacterium]
MTMNAHRTAQGLERLSDDEFDEALGAVLTEHLLSIVRARAPGHCMRVSDLSGKLMRTIAEQMDADLGNAAQVYILVGESAPRDALSVTSTKLVELRNPLPDGRQRPPLLVFVPGDLKASAEDSFGAATFETIDVRDIYQNLFNRTLEHFPAALRSSIEELLKITAQHGWQWADTLNQARFLLTIRKNGYEGEVVGASLFELGLIPDFRLLDDPAEAPGRLSKNLECVSRLTHSARTERGKVLELGLSRETHEEKEKVRALGDYFIQAGLDNPRAWNAPLALDRDKYELTFDKWHFADGNDYAVQICVRVTDISVEELAEDATYDNRLASLKNQKVLIAGSGGQKQFKVTFETEPHPEKVPAVDHFKFQVVACDTGAPIGVTKRKKSWLGGRTQRSVSFTRIQSIDWEEGWHFVRVLAFTKDNNPIPLIDDSGSIIHHGTPEDDEPFVPKLNESEQFYVVRNDDIEVEVVEGAARKYPSLTHAAIDLRFKAASEGRDGPEIRDGSVHWAGEPGEYGSAQAAIEARFEKEGVIAIPVPSLLREIERLQLAKPTDVFCWRLRLEHLHRGTPTANPLRWPELPEVAPFLQARSAYFEKVRGEEGTMVTAGRDLSVCSEELVAYGETYLQLLQAALARAEKLAGSRDALEALHHIISLDRVDIDLVTPRRATQRVSLLGPTHPLRAIWLLVWTELSESWRVKATKLNEGIRRATRDALLQRLRMLHFPTVLMAENGRVLHSVENIHPFWSLYAPADHPNPKGLIAEFCTLAGISEPEGAFQNVNAGYLAERVRRYLVQHPYVESLTINCFNAGRARALADTLMELQRNPDYRNLRYDVRLFAPDPEATGIGEDLQHLLSPATSLAENADIFSIPTGNHLAPKLSFSIRAYTEFERTPSAFPANISILFDIFPAQEVTAEPFKLEEAVSPIHGLFQDYAVSYEENSEAVLWRRAPRHARAAPLDGAEDAVAVLSHLSEALSNAAANVAVNQSGLRLRPTAVLHLNTAAKALLHHVHEVSDWVFTIDRNLGIEFFDHGGRQDRPEYLIDHSPDLSAGSGPSLVITSRSLAEVEALFARTLKERQLGDARHAAPLLGALRSLSGRLALKLVSSYSQRTEALGLALAQRFLDYQGVFADQIVLPLDAHLDLYQGIQRVDANSPDITLKRTDLALFDFNPKERLITCRLVEVKCYHSVNGLAAYEELKTRIAGQIAQSEEVLRHHFDPSFHGPEDRPDRMMKNQEFVALIEFYLDRAYRLRTLSRDVWNEAKYFLRSIESTYRMEFNRSALIFDFQHPGNEEAVEEGGIEFHRIGRDLMETLVRATLSDAPVAVDTSAETGRAEDEVPPAPPLPGLPKLERAQFKTSARDHTVDWSTLATSDLMTWEDDKDDSSKGLDNEGPDRPQIADSSPDVAKDEKTDIEKPVVASQPSPEPPEVEQEKKPDPMEESGASSLEASPGKDEVSAPASMTPEPDILIGETKSSPQFGMLGQINGRSLALDLNQTQTISLFGVQGGGKSYTLGSIIEMATMPIAGINRLSQPLASIVFHYSQTQDYKPEFTSMVNPNADVGSVDALLRDYQARPQGLSDVLLLTPKDKLEERRGEYPDLEVKPLAFSASELQAGHWRFLMGAIGNQAIYIRQVNRIMRSLRNDLTLSNLKEAIEASSLPENQRNLALMRLGLAEEYIDDSIRLSELLRPGRLVVVDLRDEFIEKDEALGLFVVILQILSESTWQGKRFNKLVVFDEAHKYIDSPDLVAGLVEVVREMRHKGTSILVASQDPPSVPVSLIELSTQIILHRFNSPGWLKHIQKANAALGNLVPAKMAQLRPGEAYIWSAKSTDVQLSHQAVKARLRPRVTAHGGDTKTAVR